MLDATGFPVGEAYSVVYLDIAAIEIHGPGDVLVSRAEFT